MAFEVYKPRGERMERVPVVSISKSSIVLNNVARQRLDSNRIELAFDRDTHTIRIQAVAEGGIEMKKTKVFGKGFFNHFGITKKGKFEAKYEPNEKAIYAVLQ
ncbi:hypothetical protein DCCM_3644 [Desulfocucumis palustris]|uniref:Uncharacterized protein n=1 Tax=Desulfocucumis palustris TaxID=1898651 RepID=A0A2L2XE68_9FIRM|nr:hypothetical protein [Desulfocucumis palustris]GBF34525.1 hypothetical protein DCCM_3644 [Desulfocucumis palustris]